MISNDMIDRSILAELTPNQRTRLVRLCGQVSKPLGYCDDFVRIMSVMGFSVPHHFDSDEEINNYRDPEDTDADPADHHHH